MKRLIPLAFLLLGVALLVPGLRSPRTEGPFDVNGFARIPVVANGRIKPMDTVGRSALIVLQGKQTVKLADGSRLQPTPWLLDVLFRPALADDYQHFLIDNPEILSIFGNAAELSQGAEGLDRQFSFNQLKGGLAELDRQAQQASGLEEQLRSPYQKEVVKLHRRIWHYTQLKNTLQLEDSTDFLQEVTGFQDVYEPGAAALRAKLAGQEHDEEALQRLVDLVGRFERLDAVAHFLAIPPSEGESEWRSLGAALRESLRTQSLSPHVVAYGGLGYAYRNDKPEFFNEIVSIYTGQLKTRLPEGFEKAQTEFRFNQMEPFYRASILYVLAFLLACASWLKWPATLGTSALYLLALGFALTTAGIGIRMYLEGRPPVTNLYSSALFVGWGSVLLGMVLERVYRNGIGSVTAATIGFLSLLVAHHLALVGSTGDTLEMLRAVLDTNFWLATHVVVITIGYAATFLAGFLAVVYILRGFFTSSLDRETARSLARMVYGIVCFATLFSLVGTVLGGIWADQSWGRFWGWDPKENGALLIVIWNAIILHARWGGLVREQGLMVLAVFGNVVTAWSWFGTNMLGVGLHSYGFMDSAFIWLSTFVATQLIIMGIGALPADRWRSFRLLQQSRPAAEAAVPVR